MRKLALAIFVLYLLGYIIPLGWRPLFTPDEVRYAEIAREMCQSGDWVVPRLAGLRYFEKPILGHWLNAAAFQVCGENAFAVRLPAALAVAGTAALLFLLLRRRGHGTEAGLVTALALLFCPEVCGVGTFAVLDSQLTLFITGTLVFSYLALQAESARPRAGYWALSGAAGGLAFLVKGFVALAVPGLVMVAFLTWERRWLAALRWVWLPALALLAVVLPWSILIHQREPDFWHYFFWVEHVQRFRHASGGQHPQPCWFFLPVLLGGALPWLVVAPAWVGGLRRRGLADPLLRFALCWLVLPFVFFSVCSGKLGTYILPCFPPLMVLAVAGLVADGSQHSRRAFTVGAYAMAGLMLLAAAALWVGQWPALVSAPLFGPDEKGKLLLLTAALALAAGIYLVAATRRSFAGQSFMFAAALVGLLVALPAAMPARVLTNSAPGVFLCANAARLAPRTVIAADERLAAAACWYYRRTDVLVFHKPGELKYGLSYPDAQGRFVSFEDLRHLLKRGDAPPVIILRKDRDYDGYQQHLPPPAQTVRQGDLILADYPAAGPQPGAVIRPAGPPNAAH